MVVLVLLKLTVVLVEWWAGEVKLVGSVVLVIALRLLLELVLLEPFDPLLRLCLDLLVVWRLLVRILTIFFRPVVTKVVVAAVGRAGVVVEGIAGVGDDGWMVVGSPPLVLLAPLFLFSPPTREEGVLREELLE